MREEIKSQLGRLEGLKLEYAGRHLTSFGLVLGI